VLKKANPSYSVAVLQVNEDELVMDRLRQELEHEGVSLADKWAASSEPGRVLTTSVERIKGLEFDVCFVIGLDVTERSSLNFTINRAYVAISRPTRRLALFCEEFPAMLRRVPKDLFETIQLERS